MWGLSQMGPHLFNQIYGGVSDLMAASPPATITYQNNNGKNGFVKKWHLVTALVTVSITIIGFGFRVGVVDAQFEDRMGSIERHVDYDDTVLARKDVLDQRLQNIENEEHKIEMLQQAQNDELQKILLENRRR